MTEPFAESEYSPEAEAIYAEFAAAGDRSESAFAELCSEHAEWADELEGLHSDFASVSGVLARLPGLGAAATGWTSGEDSRKEDPADESQELPAPQEPARSLGSEAQSVSAGSVVLPSGPQRSKAPWIALGLGLVGAALGSAWLSQRAAAERQQFQQELDQAQSALASQTQRAQAADQAAVVANQRAEVEAENRLGAQEAAADLRRQAEVTEVRAARAARVAEAAQAAGAWARIQTQLERGDRAAARDALAGHSDSVWEVRHLQRRLSALEAQAQANLAQGRSLVEATFRFLAVDRWTPVLAQAVSAGAVAPEVGEALSAADARGVGGESVVEGELGAARRFELRADSVQVYEPDLGVVLLVVDVPSTVQGLSYREGELWLHHASGALEILP